MDQVSQMCNETVMREDCRMGKAQSLRVVDYAGAADTVMPGAG